MPTSLPTSIVLTVIGLDRPGLVETLSQTIAQHEGNWNESRMARLGGQFAGILHVRTSSARAAELGRALEALSSEGLQVQIVADAHTGEEERRSLALELVGSDRPGIVREISQALASHGVNVEELQTKVANAPMSGEMLFHAKARLSVPGDATLEAVTDNLERIADDLMVDLSLDEWKD